MMELLAGFCIGLIIGFILALVFSNHVAVDATLSLEDARDILNQANYALKRTKQIQDEVDEKLARYNN